jgi:hypothetical protein
MCPVAQTFEEICAEIDEPVAAPKRTRTRGRRSPEHARKDWDRESRVLPPAVARMFDHIEVSGLRLEALAAAEKTVFWGVPTRSLDPAKRAELWARAWSRRPVETAKAIHRAIDAVLRNVYICRVYDHDVPVKMPRDLRGARVVDGVVLVDDPEKRMPSLGVRSYTEATPPEVVVVTVKAWQARRRAQRLGGKSPKAWDFTAGANTVAEVLRGFSGRTAAFDLTNSHEAVTQGDARRFERCPYFGARTFGKVPTEKIVRSPDVIFFDPPSRGTPTEQKIDLGVHQHLDLDALDREEWVITIADIASRAVQHLAPGGLLSLLVREGTRSHQHVSPEPGVADEVLASLEGQFEVVAQHRVEFGTRRNQSSTIQSRLPMMHLLLARRRA